MDWPDLYLVRAAIMAAKFKQRKIIPQCSLKLNWLNSKQIWVHSDGSEPSSIQPYQKYKASGTNFCTPQTNAQLLSGGGGSYYYWAAAAALLFVEQSLLGFSKTEQSRAEKILEMENWVAHTTTSFSPTSSSTFLNGQKFGKKCNLGSARI